MTKMSPANLKSNLKNQNEAGGTPIRGMYQTADLSLSAFLQTLGHEILNIRKEATRGIFVFADDTRLREDILAWGNNRPVPICVRAFVNAMRDLKGLVGV